MTYVLLKLKKRKQISFFAVGIFILLIFSASPIAGDDGDDGDSSKNIGYIAISLFVLGMINVVFLYAYRITRRFLSEEGLAGKTRDFTREAYIVTRKPLNWVHYLLTFSATTIIILHGFRLMNKEEEVGIFGWIATSIFLFYILTGIIIKLRIKPFWNHKNIRYLLNFLHRNLIIFIIVIFIHIVHILASDE